MWYKNGHNVGIRIKNANQIFSFGNRHCGLDEQSLRTWGGTVIQLMDEGVLTAETGKKWVEEQIAKNK